ncbi:hypothetical protein HDU91_002166 [Kappamyces sp. JEL0680]|nr:hypothetical protein HDU91_002166 [Kappamyces sp. JEL0680]
MAITIGTYTAPTAASNPTIASSMSVECHFLPANAHASLPTPGRKGDLFITHQHLEWVDKDNATVIRINYPNIVLHAIARSDHLVGDRPCLYLQLDTAVIQDENGQTVDTHHDEDEVALELRLVPTSAVPGIDDLFSGLCEASAMHQEDLQEDLLMAPDDGSGWVTSDNVDSFIPSAEQQASIGSVDGV